MKVTYKRGVSTPLANKYFHARNRRESLLLIDKTFTIILLFFFIFHLELKINTTCLEKKTFTDFKNNYRNVKN